MGRKPTPKQITDKTTEPKSVCSEVKYIKKKEKTLKNKEKWIEVKINFIIIDEWL